jgi:hypothetical protein
MSIVIAALAPVRAEQPVIVEFQVPFSGLVAHCDGFDVLEESVVSVRQITFFADGSRTRRQIHATHRGTLINSVTGFTVTDAPDAHTFFIDYSSGERAIRGLFFSVEVPGEGHIILEAGQLVFETDGSVTLNGPHQFFEGGLPFVCAALDSASQSE